MQIQDVKKLNEIAEDKINVYSLEVIQRVVKDEQCKEILTTCGIAANVAPYIEFLPEEEGGFQPLRDFMKKHAADDVWEKDFFDGVYIIGFHDNNYIALEDEGKVIYIDYEEYTKEYVNDSLEDFLCCIIKFNFMIEEYYEIDPEGDFFEEGFTEERIEEFVKYIKGLDKGAVGENTFWNLVIEECREL